MNQNVIQNIKLHYRKHLLTRILANESDINLVAALKGEYERLVFRLANYSSYVSSDSIRKSWKNLSPDLVSDNDGPSVQDNGVSLSPFLLKLAQNNKTISEDKVQEWRSRGYDDVIQHQGILIDEEIVQNGNKEETEEEEDNDDMNLPTKVTASEAVKSLGWRKQQMQSEITLLQRMRDCAFDQKLNSCAKKNITDFFDK